VVPIKDFLDPTVGGIQRSIEKPPYLLPAGKPRIPHLPVCTGSCELCCQGIGIVDYCLTLDALHLRHPRLLQHWGFASLDAIRETLELTEQGQKGHSLSELVNH